MGLTAIQGITNKSSSTIDLVNIDGGGAASVASVPAGRSSTAMNARIPWATTAAAFPAHHMELRYDGLARYWIWQSAMADGDHVRFSLGANHLCHTIRLSSGAWTATQDLNSTITVPSPPHAITAVCPGVADAQFMAATDDGKLWHTMRHSTGAWDSLGDIDAALGAIGPVTAVAGGSGTAGEAQYLIAADNGAVWHTIRHANGSWDALGNLKSMLGIPGPVHAAAATSANPGEVQFIFATADGHLYHTTRNPDGSWTGLGDVNGQIHVSGPVRAVAATSTTRGVSEFLFATADGQLWRTTHDAKGVWTAAEAMSSHVFMPGSPVTSVTAASAVTGEAQFAFTTADGHVWHMMRHPSGAWDQPANVGGQIAISGRVAAIAAAPVTGSVQFLFTPKAASWDNPGTPVHGISVPGADPTDITSEPRTIVCRDGGFTLEDMPAGLATAIRAMAGPGGFHRTRNPVTRSAAGTPRYTATAFSMAGPPSDALAAGRPGARFMYRDEGKRYSFAISGGVVTATGPDGSQVTLNQAVSYSSHRAGDHTAAPSFEMIAANGGRIFAKETGTNRFFFATMDDMFVHADDDGHEIRVPSMYFKLDPEFNQPGANQALISAAFQGWYAGHPAADRLPVYDLGLSLNLLDTMVVLVQPRVWHLLDTRPSIGMLDVTNIGWRQIVANPQFSLLAPLPALLPVLASATVGLIADLALPSGYPSVTDDEYAFGTTTVPIPTIAFTRVLGIGVGHVHWHEQYDGTTGGEIQPVKAGMLTKTPPISAADLYQFLNGPVLDGDGYIDGTCNFYILVQLANGAYDLLYIDEQSYFSQRWRAVGPNDYRGVGAAAVTAVHNDPVQYGGFVAAHYWSPFAAGEIGPASRLAVSRQVLLVTAPDPADSTKAVINSINFSYGTMDHSWRWRPLPAPAVYFPDATSEVNETLGTHTTDSAYPQTVRLREDMTIHVKGSHRGPSGTVDNGRWYQRYLPASGAPYPPKEQLTGARPVPYTHPWKFLPEAVFQAADKFSHFGVYDIVDSRSQHYTVTPVTAADAATLARAADGSAWTDNQFALCTRQLRLWWSAPLRDLELDLTHATAAHPFVGPPKAPPSMFNPRTQLRIVKRDASWIAMQWDKRDDDLVAFDALPVTVTLTNGPFTAKVILSAYDAAPSTPSAAAAHVSQPSGPSGPVQISVTAPSRIYRVRMGAFPVSTAGVPGSPVIFYDAPFSTFSGNTVSWQPPAALAAEVAQFCGTTGAYTHGTSIWFEDVTGRVGVPDQVIWG